MWPYRWVGTVIQQQLNELRNFSSTLEGLNQGAPTLYVHAVRIDSRSKRRSAGLNIPQTAVGQEITFLFRHILILRFSD